MKIGNHKISIIYWSPFLGKVATIRSVINSIISINRKKYLNLYILDCYGEWNVFKKLFKKNNISILKLQNFLSIKTKNYGFIISRFVYLITFLVTYRNLKKKIKFYKPKYLVIHLLTFIPLILFISNKFETKLILRISGRPKLNFLRYFLWKISSKNIYLVFCPTLETKKELKKLKIFDSKKIKFLPDPVLNKSDIKNKKRIKIKRIFSKKKYFLVVGRFTKQKNHNLILQTIKKYNLKDNFLFIGEGELKEILKKKIIQLKLQNQVKLLNYQKNIYNYIKDCEAVIVPSLWEDPGFVMVEAAYHKKIVISSNCKSGPKEFIGKEKCGFLFESNNSRSLKNAILRYKNTPKILIKKKIDNAKKKSSIYKIEYHQKLLADYLL
jgi:glycosyltransferase involved in cell wall biosynthesis